MAPTTVRHAIRSLIAPDLDEVALLHALLRRTRPGVMVDVGAHFGSALRPFADDGWQILAVEPDPANRAELERRVAHMPNVVIDGHAVAEHDGTLVDLYTSDVSSGISTLAPFHPSHRTSTTVETMRLDTFLAGVDEVTVLKTDTEGYDLPVLRTFPWDRLHPQGVVAEFEDRKTARLGYRLPDIADFLVGLGYIVFVSEWYPVVEYGQHHRWRSLRRYPVALEDPDAWGNLVAVDQELAHAVLPNAAWHHRVRALSHRAIRRVRRWRG